MTEIMQQKREPRPRLKRTERRRLMALVEHVLMTGHDLVLAHIQGAPIEAYHLEYYFTSWADILRISGDEGKLIEDALEEWNEVADGSIYTVLADLVGLA